VNRIRRARRLSSRDRRDAVRALAWLLVVDAAVKVLRYQTVRRAVARVRPSSRNRMTIEACVRALSRAHALLPHVRCLALAIAGECLLRRAGLPARVVIGVDFAASRTLDAHAWLQSGDLIVTGGSQASKYMPLR
jgi:hypothetical protein